MDSPYPGIDLADLWQRVRDGDVAATLTLMENCREFLKVIIRKLLTQLARRSCDSDDLIQETLAALLQKAKDGVTWNTAEEFNTAICRLAKDCTIGANRRAGAIKRGGHLTAEEAMGQNPPVEPQLVEGLLAADQVDWLKRHVSMNAALVLELRLQGWHILEIAERLGCHERTVSKYVNEIVLAYALLGKFIPPPDDKINRSSKHTQFEFPRFR